MALLNLVPVQVWWEVSEDKLMAREKSDEKKAPVYHYFKKKKRQGENLLWFKGYAFDARKMKKRRALSSTLNPVGVS